MRIFHCQRVGCRFCRHANDCTCPDNEVTIDVNGKCSGYKNGVWHYICEVKSIMGKNNMIPSLELTTQAKIGIYFITMLYDISYAYMEHGNWGWISFYKKDNKQDALTLERIFNECDFNVDNFNLFAYYIENSANDSEIIEKITGKVQAEEVNNEEYEYDYGFISPTDEFFSEDWGEHENLAYHIIKDHNWEDEWIEYCGTGVDFLIYKKHYILIHAPNGIDISVTKDVKITKKQKEFLYDYFMNRGMGLRASLYFED